jgi:hypothetical protein
MLKSAIKVVSNAIRTIKFDEKPFIQQCPQPADNAYNAPTTANRVTR